MPHTLVESIPDRSTPHLWPAYKAATAWLTPCRSWVQAPLMRDASSRVAGNHWGTSGTTPAVDGRTSSARLRLKKSTCMRKPAYLTGITWMLVWVIAGGVQLGRVISSDSEVMTCLPDWPDGVDFRQNLCTLPCERMTFRDISSRWYAPFVPWA